MSLPELTYNQREWNRQKHKPSHCRDCREKIVFLKDLRGWTFPCDAVKVVIKEGDKKIIGEDGLITHMGERIGWPLHECKAKKEIPEQNQDSDND